MKVTITNEQEFIAVDEQKIRKTLRSLSCAKEKYKLSVVYLDDAEIAKLNERYLKHEGPTDVLAFPLQAKEGEIVVSAETALRESEERGIEAEGELFLYTIHGFLHLMGYDDKTPEQAEEMHKVEKEIITGLGFTWDWD